jgi:AraC-like DNA-binding protein
MALLARRDDAKVKAMSLALTVPAARAQPGSLFDLVERGARAEGCTASLHPAVRFHRQSSPATFRKTRAFGVTVFIPVQGRKTARFRDRTLTYDPFHYLVLTGETHFDGCVVEATRDRPYLGVCLDIPAEVVAKTLAALADRDAVPDADSPEDALPAFVSPLDEAISSAVERVLRSIDDPLEREIVTPLALEELVFRLLRSDAAAVVRRAVSPDGTAATIERAMSFIRDNAARRLSVEAVARHVAMSPSHFAHRFRAVARVSPMRYLKQVRLNHARALMLSRGVAVGEAAFQVGYESASHFTRDFRAFFGAAPGEYVRNLRGQGAGTHPSAGSGK